MEITELKRTFVYNGITLPDPSPAMAASAVKDFYAATYPELVNAEIEGPVRKDNADTYTFRKAVGTKGRA
jgi:PRTRC genetic system protein C